MNKNGWKARKVLLASLIIALLVTAFPVTGVLAASGGNGKDDDGRSDEWRSMISKLAFEGAFLNRFQLLPGQFGNNIQAQSNQVIPVTGNANNGQQATVPANKLSDYQKAQRYLDKYKMVMGQAQALLINHDGFDFNGNVVNRNQANKSIKQLAMYISMLRGLREKITSLNIKLPANNTILSGAAQ